jgi:hypothetical protein
MAHGAAVHLRDTSFRNRTVRKDLDHHFGEKTIGEIWTTAGVFVWGF